MKEITISGQVIEVLDYLGEKFGIVVDWNAENTLPYIKTLCEKYINWEIATSVFWLILCIVGIIAAIKFLKRSIKIFKNEDDFFDTDDGVFMMIAGGILIIACPIIGAREIFDIIACITFPELQIYEYIMELIKDFNN